MKPLLVVVTGADGAGKSTLCAATAARLDRAHGAGTAVVAKIWDSLQSLVPRAEAERYLGVVSHRSRATLLLHAISRALELAEAERPRVLLFEGYWYKYAATELELGAPAALFETCDRVFPAPALTVHLDLAVERALARKESLTAYERGLSGGGAEAFRAFQTRARAQWAALEARVGPWVHLDGERPVEALVDELLATLPPPPSNVT